MTDSFEKRQRAVARASIAGMLVNLALVAIKSTVGIFTGSVAILSDAINNLTDSASSLITMIGTKLAQRKPDSRHPFGHGRIEYLTGLTVGVIIVVSGVEMVVTSVRGILSPKPLSFTAFHIVTLLLTVFVKIALGAYTRRTGRKYDSQALSASGADAFNDAVISGGTVLAAAVHMLWDWHIDAWAGVVISLFILRAGYCVLRDTMNKIVGEKPSQDLAENIYSLVRGEDKILDANDLMLHNYGPNTFSGSINVEIDHECSVGEMYPILRRLQGEIYRKYRTYLVFGMYAVDGHSKVFQQVRSMLAEFAKGESHCMGCHGIVVDEENRHIYCDVLLDYDCDRAGLRQEVKELIQTAFPEYQVSVTADASYV